MDISYLLHLPKGLLYLPKGLLYLPNDIIKYIFNYADKLELMLLTHVNKNFNKLILKQNHNNAKFMIEIYSYNLLSKNHGMHIKSVKRNNLYITNAAYQGFLNIMEYLKILGHNGDYFTFAYAAVNGHLNIIKWIYKDNNIPDDNRYNYNWICNFAALGGHLNIIEWLKNNNFLDIKTPVLCSFQGQQEVDICILSNGQKKNNHHIDLWTALYAAEYGYLNILEWLKDNNHKIYTTRLTYAHAIKGGHMDVIEWIRKNSDDINKLNKMTCESAAKYGQLDVLIWARSLTGKNECPWNEVTCANAVRGEFLDILKWSRKNGCPWNDTIRASAEKKLNYFE
jgi:hypothetical protein